MASEWRLRFMSPPVADAFTCGYAAISLSRRSSGLVAPKWQGSHGVALFHTGLTLETGVTDAPGLAWRTSSVGRGLSMAADATPLNEVRFLTVAEVAAIMRVSKMTVYRLVHSGELEAIRVGRSFRVPEQAVTGYLREAFVGAD
jgi:excisionase family DNA binding protein